MSRADKLDNVERPSELGLGLTTDLAFNGDREEVLKPKREDQDDEEELSKRKAKDD